MKEIKFYKKIEIPHLHFTVYLKDITELKGVEIKGGACTVPLGDRGVVIFVEDIEETLSVIENMVMIAHEIIHVIQIICEIYGMNIEEEKEHTAYLMSYILQQTFDLPVPGSFIKK